MIKRYKARVACYVFVFYGNKLLMKRDKSNYCHGQHTIPSGHVDEGEEPMVGAIRETLEETDITISEVELSSVMHRADADPGEGCSNDDYIDFFFTANKFTGKAKNMEPDKCFEVKFIDINELPANIMPHVKMALDNLLNDKLNYLTIKM